MSTLLSEANIVGFNAPPTYGKALDELEFRSRLNQRLGQLDIERERWRPHWRELQRYILPEHGFNLQGLASYEQYDGGKKRHWIIDDTASLAIDIFAAGMQSGMTSPSRPWFKLTLEDTDLMQFFPVKLYLNQCEDALYRIFNKSNFYGSTHQGYAELGVFGTWAQSAEEDDDTIVRFRPFTVGEYWLSMNAKLQVDTFYRRMWMNAAQLVEEFGIDKVSATVKNAYYSNQLISLFEVIQAIEPNDDRYYIPQCKGKKYRSAYFERSGETQTLLRIKGYNEFPIQAPRWAVVGGKTYGNSRGMLSLGNVKMLQKLVQKGLEALDKMTDPPLVAPTSMKSDNLFTVPGGVNYTDDLSAGNNGLRPLFEVPNFLAEVEKSTMRVQEQIKSGFFVDLFLLISQEPTRSNVTATEIAERHEEKMLVLGPVIERLTVELLGPVIERVFALAQRAHFLPPPPKGLQGMPIHIEYVSILAQAQKMVGLGGMQQFVAFVTNLGQILPSALDMVNADQVVQLYAEMTGADPRLLNPMEVVAEVRKQRQKQQQLQQAQQATMGASQAAKNLSDAQLDPNNALTQLLGRMQTGQS